MTAWCFGNGVLSVIVLMLSCRVYGADDNKVILFQGILDSWAVYGTIGGTGSWTYLKKDEEWETCRCPPTGNPVCQKVQKYLVTSLIDVSKANKIQMDITYGVRKCSDKSKQEKKCVEYFGIYVMRSSNTFVEKDPIQNADYVLVKNTSSAITFPPDPLTVTDGALLVTSGFKYMVFGFLDVGFCGTIKKIVVSYITCPTQSPNLLQFPARSAPASGILNVTGTCTSNSEPKGKSGAYMLCAANGTVVFVGQCICLAGFEKQGTQCKACGINHFKDHKGDDKCTPCGKHSSSTSDYKKCICKDGYYRLKKYPTDFLRNCEKPPEKPRNLDVKNITAVSAVLFWKQPLSLGTGFYVHYDILCNNCPKEKRVFKRNINQTIVKLTLESYVEYIFSVVSVNNITEATGQTRSANISLRTPTGVPSAVRNFKWKTNSDGSITLSWDPPFAKGGPDIVYVITYGGNTKTTKSTSYKIEKSATTKTYTFEVRARTSAGTSSAVKTPALRIEGGVPLEPAIGITVGLFVLLVVAIVIAVYFWRKRHPKHLQPVRLENGEVIIPSRFKGQKVYVDPMTYQDLAEAVTDIAHPLEKNWIELENIIGGGEFGDVYKGTLTKPYENGRSVAIKTLRSGANKQARDDFLSEAAIMGQFDDPNVIVLEGVVVREKPMMIVTEFMSNGSLDNFLQSNDGKFTALQLLGMSRGVSSGMTYLSEMGFIHRDLAARNILVDETLRCKVADFGMSRELKMDDTYDTRGGKIPVRWTAPEAIQYKKFTTASDVWSYGILLWEIMSYGERPYWDWGNYEVLERIGSGYRLPPPMNCPKGVHDLMLSCWQKDRIKRPKFRNIRDTVDKWIRNPDLLNQEESVVVKRDEHLNYASMKTIKEWLDSFKMGQYTKNFIDGGFATPRQILTLTEQDLVDLGISIIGHRKKIFKSIQATKRQMEHPPLLERENSLRI